MPIGKKMTKLVRLISMSLVLAFVLNAFQTGVAHADPANMILLWDGAGAVPTGWTDISASGQPFNNRFPRGAAAYGTTGGTGGTHTHTVSLVSCDAPSATTQVTGSGTNHASSVHTHTTLSASSTSAVSNLPSYRNLRVIRYNSGVPATIPAGAIAIFDTTPPAGWTQYSAQDNYFVRGASAAGGTGGTNTDTHTVSATLAASTSYQAVSTTTPRTPVATNTHTHTVSGSTASIDKRPPFITVILAKANSNTAIPYGMIGMFDASPTGNWSILSGSGGPFNLKFIVGGSSYGTTGGADSHSHSNLSITTGNPSATRNARTSTPNASAASSTHTHSVTLSFNTVSHLPPYRDVIFAKYSSVTPPTIDITAPADISGWNLTPLGTQPLTRSGTLQVNVTPDGTSWSVTAKDLDGTTNGFMTEWTGVYGTAKLGTAMQVQGPAATVILPNSGGTVIATSTGDNSISVTFIQTVLWTDEIKTYRIVVTFIGSIP